MGRCREWHAQGESNDVRQHQCGLGACTSMPMGCVRTQCARLCVRACARACFLCVCIRPCRSTGFQRACESAEDSCGERRRPLADWHAQCHGRAAWQMRACMHVGSSATSTLRACASKLAVPWACVRATHHCSQHRLWLCSLAACITLLFSCMWACTHGKQDCVQLGAPTRVHACMQPTARAQQHAHTQQR